MPHEARQADLIVNTTPIGMWPHTQASPLQRSSLRSDQVVYDIVYNPAQTQLMTEAKLAGAHAIGGLSMLIGQAAEAFTLWTGQQMPLLDVKKGPSTASRNQIRFVASRLNFNGIPTIVTPDQTPPDLTPHHLRGRGFRAL